MTLTLPDPAVVTARIAGSLPFVVTGRVASIVGDTVTVAGMTAPVGGVCRILSAGEVATDAVVIGFSGAAPVLSPLRPSAGMAAGDRVRLLAARPTVPVGEGLCGRVLNAMGDPIDGRPLPAGVTRVPAGGAAPGSLSRPPIDTAITTGVAAIDALMTVGVGQRMGIFAGSGVGKSTLLGMICRGTSADKIVIAMVGERGREVREFIDRSLGEAAARAVVVVATSDEPAACRVAAAMTATSIAEAFRDAGDHVLLLVDSVTRLAMAQREVGLAAGQPPTTRGYPPSVFSLMPQLVERAGRTEKGAITAFYTVLVEGDDPNEPIADTLRGLLDGHIHLSRRLATAGHFPPIDVAESLSRLQPQLINAEDAEAAAAVREHVVRYRENEDLISIGAYKSGSDPRTDAAIALRDPIDLVLRQDASRVAPVEQTRAQLRAIAAAGRGEVTTPQAVAQ